MPQYLLPCSDCNQSFPVATRQAGQTVQCANCDASVEVPKLGELKQLPIEGGADAVKKSEKRNQSPNRLKGWLFSGGLMIAVLAGVAGYALLNYANSLYANVDEFANAVEEVSSEAIDAMKPAEMWDWWTQVSAIDLGEWQEHSRVGSNIQSGILANIAYGLFGLAGLGIISMLCSFAVKK